MDWGVEGKAAVVTGAAAGIGAGIAHALADAGAKVYGLDRAWTENPDHLVATSVDVSDQAAVEATMATIAADEGGLDILVNNAGTMRARDSFEEYTPEDWNVILAVNLHGVYFCTAAAAGHMKAPGAAIVNVASIAGRNGKTLSPPYAASKAGVINLTRSSANMLAPAGIRVNAVAPGIIDTDFNVRLGKQFGPRQKLTPEEFVARRAEIVPLGRLGTPEDVANVVCFLASPYAGYLTGQTVNVDGGILMD